MKKMFFITLFFANLDLVFAAGSCQSARDTAFNDCDKKGIEEPLRLMEQIQSTAQQPGAGTVPGVELAIKNTATSTRQVNEFEAKCYKSFKSCIQTCQQEAAQAQANLNEDAALQAQQAEKECNQQPAENLAAAKKAGLDLNQVLPLLTALLGQLKGDGGESGDACAKDPAQCKVDAAADTPGATLANTTRDAGDGSFLDSGLNTNDAPAMGEKVDPSMAQFGQSPGGGGGGFGGGGSGGGPGGRARGVPEVNPDGTPKINFGATGGAGGKNGGMQVGAASASKGSGNPVASRVGIDDGRAGSNGVGNAVDKALQARGLASGQPGGISAAHAFDNFQKIEKRIQTERNQLAEL